MAAPRRSNAMVMAQFKCYVFGLGMRDVGLGVDIRISGSILGLSGLKAQYRHMSSRSRSLILGFRLQRLRIRPQRLRIGLN